MDQPTPESTILSLPSEIRNTIYYFILVRDQPIAIFSKPRNKSENGVYPVYFPENRRIAELTASDGEAKPRQENKHSRKFEPTTDSRRLFRVNKQIYKEASHIFYTQNTFAVGNAYSDAWHTTRPVHSVRALKTFVSRVPNQFIERITKVKMIMHLKPTPGHWGDCEKSLHVISRILVKHFKGLEAIDFKCTPDTDGRHNYADHYDAPWSTTKMKRNSESMEKTLRILVKHQSVKKITIKPNEWIDPDIAFVNFLGDIADGRKVVSVR